MKIHRLPFHLARFEHSSGLPVLMPLTLPEVARLGAPPERLASQIERQMEKDLAQKGRYQELLPHLLAGRLQADRLELTVGPSAKGLYPVIPLAFDFFWLVNERGQHLGFLPVLALQAAGDSLTQLREHFIESVELELIRHQRLGQVSDLLVTQWYHAATLHQTEIELPFYTLTELEEIERLDQETLLKRVAHHLAASDPLMFGLEDSSQQMSNALRGRQRSSVLLVGESGQGKTTLIHHLAHHRHKQNLGEITIWEATAAQLLHRLTDEGGWEGQLGKLCRELRDSGDWLYVPDLSELFEVGQYAGNNRSMADYLRPYLTRGEITLLTECTPAAASQIELRAPGYLSLFARIDLPSQERPQLQQIVENKVEHLALRRGMRLDREAVQETLRLQLWFSPYSGLPGKAIQFLDALLADISKRGGQSLGQADIYRRFCEETGMPEFMVNPAIPLDLEKMEAFFRENIYGQDEAISTVLDLLIAIKTAVIRRGKPLASLLFAGPTGVGKTEMAKVLAQYLFGDRGRMIRFDMSEYQDLPALMRLTGDDGRGEGLLTAAVRQQPFSVVLFDELEKVNPLFYDLLLQILGEGRLTSSTGRVADFCSTLIIMTSNLGARDFQSEGMGFVPTLDQSASAAAHFRAAVRAHFRPELFNRLDRIIAFAPLDRKVLRLIVNRELSLVRQREGIRGRPLELEISQAAADYLGETGYHPLYGARFLQRVLQQQLVLPLAERLNSHPHWQALRVQVDRGEEGLSFALSLVEQLSAAEQAVQGTPLTLDEFGNKVSTNRRTLTQISSGLLYVQFLNALDGLRSQLRRLKKQGKEAEFWQDKKQSHWYTQALELVEQQATLAEAIEVLEQDILLLLAGFASEQPASMQRCEKWQSQLDEFTKSLIHHMHPHWERCTLAIYGSATYLLELAQLYVGFAKTHDLQVKAQYIWYSSEADAARQEAIRLAQQQDNLKVLNKAEALLPYQFTPLDLQQPHFEHTPCGMLLEIRGSLAYPYLAGEGGAHLFTDGDGSKDGNHWLYHIQVEPKAMQQIQIPPNIHRRQQGRPGLSRRIFFIGGGVMEKKYSVNFNTGPRHLIWHWLDLQLEGFIMKVLKAGA